MAAINVTFKNNDVEQELFEWLNRRTTNKSAFIKDLLMREKLKEENQDTKILKGFLRFEE